jgi:hypothetical protein
MVAVVLIQLRNASSYFWSIFEFLAILLYFWTRVLAVPALIFKVIGIGRD